MSVFLKVLLLVYQIEAGDVQVCVYDFDGRSYTVTAATCDRQITIDVRTMQVAH